MGSADQGPFALNLVETAEEKLPEPSRLFDLTEDGFDNLFA
jgi:hypothetical protein